MLTAGQGAHFDTFGFLVFKQRFPTQEIASITEEADKIWAEERRGGPFTGDEEQAIAPFVERSIRLTDLVTDDRIYLPLQELLGPSFVWAGSEGNITTRGHHPWHPDRPATKRKLTYLRLKVSMYLDPVTAESGSLRVIPGSHKMPLHTEIEPEEHHQRGRDVAPFDVAGVDVPYHPLESEPGDVIFFNQSLWHGVFNAWAGRRFMVMKFAAQPTEDWHVEELTRYKKDVLSPDKRWLSNESPRIRGMVEPLVRLAAARPA